MHQVSKPGLEYRTHDNSVGMCYECVVVSFGDAVVWIGCGWVQKLPRLTHLFPAAPPVLLLVIAVVHFRLLRCEASSEFSAGIFLVLSSQLTYLRTRC